MYDGLSEMCDSKNAEQEREHCSRDRGRAKGPDLIWVIIREAVRHIEDDAERIKDIR
jgi:hypothetical protein